MFRKPFKVFLFLMITAFLKISLQIFRPFRQFLTDRFDIKILRVAEYNPVAHKHFLLKKGYVFWYNVVYCWARTSKEIILRNSEIQKSG